MLEMLEMLETDEMSELDLPPEIVRRLQVEELWARRHVLAELMNAGRLKLYYQRRGEIRPESIPFTEIKWEEPQPKFTGGIVPFKKSLMG